MSTDGTSNSTPTNYVRPGWYPMALFRPADYLTIVSEDLTAGGTTTDMTRFSYFPWLKHIRSSAVLYQHCDYSGWSAAGARSVGPHAPGVGWAWTDAWTKMGACQ